MSYLVTSRPALGADRIECRLHTAELADELAQFLTDHGHLDVAVTQDAAPPVDLDMACRMCAPFDCDDPDRHLGAPSEYTPLKNRGCRCSADFDGRDCMCFEGYQGG